MRIKYILIASLLSISCHTLVAQQSSDTIKATKKTTYLLPDGSVFSLEKWDSLEQAWGKGRVSFQHSQQDDAKGIMHIVRVTDEMLQQIETRNQENEKIIVALLNKSAPDFELTDMQGKKWSLKKLRGKIVVLNFWFTTCMPCIEEMPQLNKLVKTYDNSDVVFLGLTYNNAHQIKLFQKKRSFDYVLLSNSHKVDEKYKITSWPTSIVIDKKGNIKKIMYSNPKIREELTKAIDLLM